MANPQIPGKVVFDPTRPMAAGVAVIPCPHCGETILIQQMVSAVEEAGESDG